MIKFFSHNLITLSLILGFAPAVKPTILSESQDKIPLNPIAQTTSGT